ncbi:MAG: alpha/beta hydrolase [Anaerolineales bacterium]
MNQVIEPLAEPFLHPGDEIGCLLIHGFTGSPSEMRLLGQHLADRGRTVVGPRLYGHGTQEQDIERAKFRDWLASAEDGYHMLKPNCHRLFLIGLSMGAVLALTLASRLELDGVVALSTPYKLPEDPRLRLLRPLSLFWKRVRKGESDWQDPSMENMHFAYRHYPVHGVAELKDLLAMMRQSLNRINAPALLMQSKKDGSYGVTAEAMPAIAGSLAGGEVETVWLEQSGHVITLDIERDLVFAEVSSFIERISGRGLASKG